MELVSLAKEMLQDVAEHVASYRLGQTTLRYLDRALWTVEKCARWAVPPPLEQDERPQPELVRPLPWPLFLLLLVALRVARESISLFNLVLGKPPLRSADVVTYVQSKRRYLRTLKYQGNRMMRARGDAPPRRSWLSSVQSLLEFTMCFRRPRHYGNNNTMPLSNNDEVLVVKRGKRSSHDATPAPPGDTTMERLIEKIMVDLDAESDEDSSYTLTNVTSIRSDQSGYNSDSDQDTAVHVSTSTPNSSNSFDALKTNNFTALPSEITLCSITEVNVTTSLTEQLNHAFDNTDATRTDGPSIGHCEENGNDVGKKQKIANGRAVSSPPNSDRTCDENGVY